MVGWGESCSLFTELGIDGEDVNEKYKRRDTAQDIRKPVRRKMRKEVDKEEALANTARSYTLREVAEGSYPWKEAMVQAAKFIHSDNTRYVYNVRSVELVEYQDDTLQGSTVYKFVGGAREECKKWCSEGIAGPMRLPFVNQGYGDPLIDTGKYTKGGLTLLMCTVSSAAYSGCTVFVKDMSRVKPRYLISLEKEDLDNDVLETDDSCLLAKVQCPFHPSSPLELISFETSALVCKECPVVQTKPATSTLVGLQAETRSARNHAGDLLSKGSEELERLDKLRYECHERAAYLRRTIDRKYKILLESLQESAKEVRAKVARMEEECLSAVNTGVESVKRAMGAWETVQLQAGIVLGSFQFPTPSISRVRACALQSRVTHALKEAQLFLEQYTTMPRHVPCPTAPTPLPVDVVSSPPKLVVCEMAPQPYTPLKCIDPAPQRQNPSKPLSQEIPKRMSVYKQCLF